jgi:DNA-binding transcriptional regulator YbjK
MGGIYGWWAAWLLDFGRGEQQQALDALPSMHVEELGSVAAVRLSQRCAQALSLRLERCGQMLERDLERASSPDDLRRALTAARSRLVPLRELARSPLLFEELRASMEQQLQQTLERIQHDLEREARQAEGSSETLLRIVREQPLCRAVAIALGPADEAEASQAPRGSRQVLLG